MKKKLLAMLSLVTILAMESVTVFATETPSPSSTYNSVTEETQSTTDSTSTVEGSIAAANDSVDQKIATIMENYESETDAANAYLTNTELQREELTYATGGDGGEELKVSVFENGVIVVESSEDSDPIMLVSEDTEDGVTIMKSVTTDDNGENIGITLAGDGFKNMDTQTKGKVAAKVASFINELKNNNSDEEGTSDTSTSTATSYSFVAFDYEGSTNANGEIEIPVTGLKENDIVYVLHLMDNDEWEILEATVNSNGTITFKSNGQSPFIIMKLNRDVTSSVDYATQTTTVTNTVSGDVSPKTTDAEPYAAMVAMISLACVAVFARKLVKR